MKKLKEVLRRLIYKRFGYLQVSDIREPFQSLLRNITAEDMVTRERTFRRIVGMSLSLVEKHRTLLGHDDKIDHEQFELYEKMLNESAVALSHEDSSFNPGMYTKEHPSPFVATSLTAIGSPDEVKEKLREFTEKAKKNGMSEEQAQRLEEEVENRLKANRAEKDGMMVMPLDESKVH